MNVEDPERVALHEIVARVRAEAAARGVETAGSELVGLLPAGAAAGAARESLGLDDLDESRLLEVRLLDAVTIVTKSAHPCALSPGTIEVVPRVGGG